MKAVVFDGPHKVSIQDRPVPKCKSTSGYGPSPCFRPSGPGLLVLTGPWKVQHGEDIIVKVQATALCGS